MDSDSLLIIISFLLITPIFTLAVYVDYKLNKRFEKKSKRKKKVH